MHMAMGKYSWKKSSGRSSGWFVIRVEGEKIDSSDSDKKTGEKAASTKTVSGL